MGDLGTVERMWTVDELQRATVEGDIVPFFQPIVHLGTGAVVGWEALARWMHPVCGVVASEEFIAVAEEHGLIGWIDEQMLVAGLEMLAATGPGSSGSPFVAVNVSARHLGDGVLADRVLAELQRLGLPGRRLCLEVTEPSSAEDLGRALAELALLRSVGVHLAIDDFGTGRVSFQHLRQLPIDRLKLDPSFIESTASSAHDTSIVRAILAMARELGIDVIAEGIETEEQERLLRRLGCPLGQGYRYGRPRPVPVCERPGEGIPTERRPYPVPSNEASRLSLLHDTRVLDTEPEPMFDAIAHSAAELCGTAFAAVALVDSDRVWNKAAHGAPASVTIPRETAVCAWTVCSPHPLVITDLVADGRFAGNPWVDRTDGLRFYAGIPLVASNGTAFGTLCVMDREPRELDTAQLDALATLAAQAAALLELRARLHQLDAAHRARDRAESALHATTTGAQALVPGRRRTTGAR